MIRHASSRNYLIFIGLAFIASSCSSLNTRVKPLDTSSWLKIHAPEAEDEITLNNTVCENTAVLDEANLLEYQSNIYHIQIEPLQIKKPELSEFDENFDKNMGEDAIENMILEYQESKEDFSVCEDTEPVEISPKALAVYNKAFKSFGIRLDGTENKDLLDAVAEWLGTPYRWGGCSGRGVDCSCLVKNIYKNVYDIRLPRTSVNIYHKMRRIKKEKLQEGDLICFKTQRGRRRVNHVGIYLKDNKFVHASSKHGVTIANLNKPYYKKRFVAAGRIANTRISGLSKSGR